MVKVHKYFRRTIDSDYLLSLKDRSCEEENLPSIESLEISKNKAVKLAPSHVGGEDEDDIPDMADYEEADNIEIDPVSV